MLVEFLLVQEKAFQFQQAGKSLLWWAVFCGHFSPAVFSSPKGFIIAGPVAKGAKTARESAIEFGRGERILMWDTRLKVEYCVSISRGSPALLVKTATISYGPRHIIG